MASDKAIKVTAETDWPRLLDDAAASPVLLEREGVLFRLAREDEETADGDDPDPERVRRTLAQTVGTWADLDVDRVIADLYEARRAGTRPADRP